MDKANIKSIHEFVINNLIANASEQDKYNMYGDNMESIVKITSGHTMDVLLSNSPDEILRRPNLFKIYVKRCLELLNEVSKINNLRYDYTRKQQAIEAIDLVLKWGNHKVSREHGQIIDYEIDGDNVTLIYAPDYRTSRLDAVWAFLIAASQGKTEFIVPIKWLPDDLNKGIASIVYCTSIGDFESGTESQYSVLKDFLMYDNYYIMKHYGIQSVIRIKGEKYYKFKIVYK